jgi:hypothetical protein
VLKEHARRRRVTFAAGKAGVIASLRKSFTSVGSFLYGLRKPSAIGEIRMSPAAITRYANAASVNPRRGVVRLLSAPLE